MAGKKIHDMNEVDNRIEKIGGPLALGAVVLLLIIIVVVLVIKSCGAARTVNEDGAGSSSGMESDGISASLQMDLTQTSLDASGNDIPGGDEKPSGGEGSTGDGQSFQPSEPGTGGSISLYNREFLDAEDYPEVTQLIQAYFDAYADCSVTELLGLVDYNGGTPVTQDELEQRAQIVEGYQNLVCYLIEGMDTNSFVVYASYDIKFYNISAPAPTLTRFYVVIADDQTVHIYNGEISAKLNAYLKSVNEYGCVRALSERIDQALEEECGRDERLRELMEILYGQGGAQGTGEQE